MLNDYWGLVPGFIAILTGVLAVVVAEFPLETRRRKVAFISVVGALTLLASGTALYSQYLIEMKISTGDAATIEEMNRIASAREQLGAYIAMGHELVLQCTRESQPSPEQQAEVWGAAVEQFLRDRLGRSYVARFRSDAGLVPMTNTTIQSQARRDLWSWLQGKLVRLEQFSQELPSAR